MRLHSLLCGLSLCGLWALSCASLRAETVVEAWRSPFGTPRSVSANPTDGSCWAATGASVMHIAADGTILHQTNGFGLPWSVSVNPSDGSCWVADWWDGQVVHLSESGEELSRTGVVGPAVSVSVNPSDGSCWVAENTNANVVHLSESGQEIGRYGGVLWPQSVSVNSSDCSYWVAASVEVVHLSESGEELWRGGGFSSPSSVSVDPGDGSCWVADRDNNQVVHLSESGAELWRGGGFSSPSSVSVNPGDGSCWVASGNDVIHVSAGGSTLSSTLVGGSASVSVDSSDGSCWVGGDFYTIGGKPGVMHLSPTGAELWQGGGFSDPQSVSANPADGSCWVADTDNHQVVHLSESGQEIGRYQEGWWWPQSVSVNSSDGSCWAGVWEGVVHLSASGEKLWLGGGFSWPPSVSVNPSDGSCWVADRDNNQVVHLSESGEEMWRGGGFSSPSSVSVNPGDGSCWVADTGNGQVVHLSDSGAELWRGAAWAGSVSVNASDGSCWVGAGSEVVHLSETGEELWRGGGFGLSSRVSVNPSDGSCWVGTYDEVVHLSVTGDELWRGGTYSPRSSVSVNPTDGSCWVAEDYNSQVVHLMLVAPPVTPTAAFTGAPTSGPAPLEVAFSDQSVGPPTSWSWTFGDGGASVERYPVHTYTSPGQYTVSLTVSNAAGSDTETKEGYIEVGPPAEFHPYLASVRVLPDTALDGYMYYLDFTVGNSGDAGGRATIALDEYNLSGITMAEDYFSPEPPTITKTIRAHGQAHFSFGIRHRWDWIDAPEPAWQAILDGAISCLPIGLIQEWADAIRVAGVLRSVSAVRGYVDDLIQAYGIASALLHDHADFLYIPGPGTTAELMTFDQTVSVWVPDWKKNAFWTSTYRSVEGKICSQAGNSAGVLGLPLLALQAVLEYAAHEHYEIAYDPDPDYTTVPEVEPIGYPELDPLPNSPGKAAAVAAKAWAEVETARAKAWVRMAAAEEAGDDYWRQRQAQAAEELGRVADAKMAELQRLCPAVPGLQAGSTAEEVAAFRQSLLLNGLPEIESAFLLRQGWTQADLDALVQSMVNTSDELYETPGLQADSAILGAAGACAQTAHAADVADSPKITLGLPTTRIIPSGTIGRDGEFVSDVLVQLDATTPTDTVVAAVDYSLDDGGIWTPYTSPFTVSDYGSTTVLARATDNLGQREDPPARRVVTKRVSVFADVAADSWAWAQVEATYWSGVVQGYPDGLYHPEIQVTRDQMAVYVSRALGIPTGGASVADYQPPATASFPDVPADQWAYKYIEYAAANNIVQGYEDGSYHPEYEVTRDQMAVYVARSLVAPSGEAALTDYVPPDPRNFPDVPDTFWAWKHVEYCVEHGVVQGYEDGNYHPEIVVTRDQMAVYVARAFELTM